MGVARDIGRQAKLNDIDRITLSFLPNPHTERTLTVKNAN